MYACFCPYCAAGDLAAKTRGDYFTDCCLPLLIGGICTCGVAARLWPIALGSSLVFREWLFLCSCHRLSLCFPAVMLVVLAAGVPVCCCIWASTRSRIRARYGINGDWCGDCCAMLFCTCCALTQEAREIEMRGGEAAFKGATIGGPGTTVIVLGGQPA